ncbi:MAG: hypothetical protein M3301_00410, partial [Chloroflexota bacterium]|nr:hypothetical protein [Chloroflexota bacterium]
FRVIALGSGEEPEESATAEQEGAAAEVQPLGGDRSAAPQRGRARKIADMLPTEDEVPADLVLIEEGHRTADDITSTFPDPDDAAAQFAAWGWEGNAFRVFGVPEGSIAPTGGTASIDVSIHRFANASVATEALFYLVNARETLGTFDDAPVAPLGELSVAIAGQVGDHNEASVYVQRRDVVIRVTATSPEGDPLADAQAVAQTVAAK